MTRLRLGARTMLGETGGVCVRGHREADFFEFVGVGAPGETGQDRRSACHPKASFSELVRRAQGIAAKALERLLPRAAEPVSFPSLRLQRGAHSARVLLMACSV